MPIIGSAHIEIRALDKFFRSDVEKAVGKLKNVGIELRVDADISPAQKKIDDLKKQVKSTGIEVTVKADVKKLEEDIKKAANRAKSAKVTVTPDHVAFVKSVRDLNDKVKNLKIKVPVYADPKFFKRDIDAAVRNAKLNPVKLTAQIDNDSVQEAIDSVNQSIQDADLNIQVGADTAPAQSETQAAAEVIEATNPEMTVGANTAVAEAQIAWLTRARKVKIVADFEKSAIKSFKGIMEAITGLPPITVMREAITNLLGNFSQIVVVSGAVVSALGAVSAALISLTGSALTIVSDIGNLVGLLALAPAGLTAMYMATKALKTSFEGFSAAVKKGGPDIEALHPAARAAATAMHEVVKVMNTEIKGNFWREASDEMIEFSDRVMPRFSEHMQDVARDFGHAFGEMLQAVSDFTENNRLDSALENIRVGLGWASDAVRPLTEAFLILGDVGSKYIRDLGVYIRQAGEDFNAFIREAERTGQIDIWIREGITALQDLGSIVASTVTIFGNLAEAARRAGFGGLSALAQGLRDIASATGEALFLERLEEVFRGAGAGADELVRGISLIGDTFMENTGPMAEFLDLSGQIGRIAFENLDALLNAEGFGDGILRALEGFRNGLDAATPGFEALGRIIGNLGQIAGTMFEAMAPGFNNLMITIDEVVARVRDGFIAVIPVVNHFIDMLAQIARGPITLIASAIGELMELFGALPTPIQSTIIALLALNTALRVLSIRTTGLGLASLGTALAGVAARATGSATQVAAVGAAAGAAGASAGAATSGTRRFGSMLLTLAKRAGAIAAVVITLETLFGAYQQSAGAAQKNTANLSTAMQQYGIHSQEAVGATEAILTGSKTAVGALGDNVNSLIGFGQSMTPLGGLLRKVGVDFEDGLKKIGFANKDTNSAAQAFEKLGWNVEDVSTAINKSGGEWTDYRHKLEELSDGTDKFGRVSEELSQAVLGNADAAGITKHELLEMINAYDIGNREIEKHVQKQIEAHEAAKKSADFNRQVADAVSASNPILQSAAEGWEVLSDAHSSVSDKMGALQATMAGVQLTKYGSDMQRATTASMNMQAMTDATGESISQLAEPLQGINGFIDQATGKFTDFGPAARNAHAALSDVGGQITELGVNIYDNAIKQGKTVPEAARLAKEGIIPLVEDVRQSLRNMGVDSEAAIDGIIQQMGILPTDFEISLNAEDNISAKIRETQLVAQALENGDYSIALQAINENAMAEIADAVDAGEDYAKGDYQAVFEALAEEVGVTDAVKLLEDASGEDYQAIMEMVANTKGLDEIHEAEAVMNGINGKTVHSNLEFIQKQPELFDTVKSNLDSLDGRNATAQMNVIDELTPEVGTALRKVLDLDATADPETVLRALDEASPLIKDALGLAEDFGSKRTTVHMDALDNASPTVVGAIDRAIDFDGTEATATLGALDDLSPAARDALAEVLGIDSSEGYALLGAINDLSPEAQRALGDVAGVNNAKGEARLEAINNVDPMVQSAISDIGSLDGLTGEARLEAINNASKRSREALADVLGLNSAEGTAILDAIDNLGPTSEVALQNLMSVDGKTATSTLFAVDQTLTGVASAHETMSGLTDVTRSLNATNSTETGRAAAQTTMDGLMSVTRDLRANNVTPATKAQAQATMDSLKDVMRDLEANNATPAVKAQAQATMDSLKDVMRNLEASDRTGPPTRSATRALEGVPNVKPSIDVQSNAPSVAQQAREALANIKDRFVNIFTRRAGDNAEGGIYTSQGQIAYAQGGILQAEAYANGGVRLPSNISSFASGSENHVAQISQGKWPVRIWSEPETGGEAYIPLGLSKRPRSLDILKKVAEMFGFSLVKKFEDGGILKGIAPTKAGYFADGGFNDGRNITSYMTSSSSTSTVQPVSTTGSVFSPTIYVQPSTPVNEEQLADNVASELFFRYKNGF